MAMTMGGTGNTKNHSGAHL